MTDDYVHLCVQAREALRAVIAQTEPGTGWKLHEAFHELQVVIGRKGEAPSRIETPTERRERERGERMKRRDAWKGLSDDARESAALQALGEERRTVRETLGGMAELLPEHEFYDSDVRRTLTRLLRSGDVKREPEQWRGKMRYRYFRATDLRGPIAELDRQFGQDVA